MTITPAIVEELLRSTSAEPTLVVHAGAASVVPAADLQRDRYPGSVVVASREDLQRVGSSLNLDDPSEHDLVELAARLNTTVTQLGG